MYSARGRAADTTIELYILSHIREEQNNISPIGTIIVVQQQQKKDQK